MALLLEALERQGVAASPAVWTDPDVDWGAFDAVILRGTWDYQIQLGAFLAWVDAVAGTTRLLNAADVVRWNTDKRYLRDLEAAGVPVVPTFWPDGPLPELEDFVVKPSVSAGGMNTKRFSASERGEAADLAEHIRASGQAVMVQPYVASVDAEGERAVLFFNGLYSHTIRKGALLPPKGSKGKRRFGSGDATPAPTDPAQVAAAQQALTAAPTSKPPLYARVDLVRGSRGEWLLLELELTEPAMFLAHSEGAANRFAAAIVAATQVER